MAQRLGLAGRLQAPGAQPEHIADGLVDLGQVDGPAMVIDQLGQGLFGQGQRDRLFQCQAGRLQALTAPASSRDCDVKCEAMWPSTSPGSSMPIRAAVCRTMPSRMA